MRAGEMNIAGEETVGTKAHISKLLESIALYYGIFYITKRLGRLVLDNTIMVR